MASGNSHKQEGMEFNGLNRVLIYVHEVNLFCGYTQHRGR
jgi:hypothetical protein